MLELKYDQTSQLFIPDPKLSGGMSVGLTDFSDSRVGTASEEGVDEEDLPLRIRGTSVLLVEDNVDNRLMMGRYLVQSGADVDFAENGFEGIKKALTNSYDIVLMDILMPRIDGLDAIRKLRGYGYEGSVVAVTGHSKQAERDECLRAGFDDYLTKPVQRSRLLLTIASQPRRRVKPLIH